MPPHFFKRGINPQIFKVKKLTSEYPRIKYSSEYLNDRVQENKLAKQERFKEAAKMKLINDKRHKKKMRNRHLFEGEKCLIFSCFRLNNK